MKINKYTMSEAISKSPKYPGVYVWYCNLCIGNADIKSDENLYGILDSYTSKFGKQPMFIEASLNFDLSWEGKIHAIDKKTNLWSDGFEEKDIKDGSSIIRSVIYDLIINSQKENHVFFQPLYIGKSEAGLRSRLKQHVFEFRRLKESIDLEDNFQYIGEDNFAQRIAKLGFSEEELVVYTIDIGCPKSLNINSEQIKKIISIVELYLNRWSTPLLGRR